MRLFPSFESQTYLQNLKLFINLVFLFCSDGGGGFSIHPVVKKILEVPNRGKNDNKIFA